jgi:hypothetical protein
MLWQMNLFSCICMVYKHCFICRIQIVLLLLCWLHRSCCRPIVLNSHLKSFQVQEAVVMWQIPSLMSLVSEVFHFRTF